MSVFKYVIHGNTYEVSIDSFRGDKAEVTVNGVTYEVGIVREAQRPPKLERTKAVPGAAPQPQRMKPQGILGTVTTPLPGTVLKIAVREGDTVEAGQCVCIVEAMKMENEIYAPLGGTVKKIAAREGQSVLEGELLLEIGG